MNRNARLSVVACALVVSCATPAPPPVRPSASSSTPAVAGGGRIFVVEPVEGLALYQDEARSSLLAVAAWARGRGLRVADPATTWQVLSRGRAGRSAVTGARCGKPLEGFEALERWQPLLGADATLWPTVTCEKAGCTLTVDLTEGLEVGGDEIAYFEAPYARRAPEPAALASALAHLAPKATPSGGLGIGGLLGGRRPRAPRPERLGWGLAPLRVGGGVADDSATRPGAGVRLADVLPGGTGTLRGCFGADDATTNLSFTVGADGRMTHCEATYEIDREDACACRVLSADARLPASMRGDRFRATLQLTAAETVSADGDIVSGLTVTYLDRYRARDGRTLWRPRVTDPSIADWSPPASSAVDRCFAGAHGAAARNIDVEVRFGPDGRATSARITGTRGPKLSGAEATCVRSALLAARAPCPATPASSAAAEVQVRFLPTPKTAHAP